MFYTRVVKYFKYYCNFRHYYDYCQRQALRSAHPTSYDSARDVDITLCPFASDDYVTMEMKNAFVCVYIQDDSDGDFAGSYNKASVTSSRIMPSSYINKLSKYYRANVTTIRTENFNNTLSKYRTAYLVLVLIYFE